MARRSIVVAAGEHLEADVYCCVVSLLTSTQLSGDVKLSMLPYRQNGWRSYCQMQSANVCDLLQGLSHCFKKNEDGRLADVMVIEPIGSSSLECMAAGEE